MFQRRIRVWGPAAVAAAVMALTAACGGSGGGAHGDNKATNISGVINGTLPADGPAEQGGVLTLNDASDSPTLDVHKTATAYTHSQLSGLVYSKLLEFNVGQDIPYGSMDVHGDLAEKWSHSDDGKTWTFNLRQGVTWQNIAPVNGRAFTSADVVCTVQRIKDLPGVQKNLVDAVSSMDTPDANTIVFNLSTPVASFDENMASFYMEILPCEGTRGEFNLAETAIGTGPFILQKWDKKVQKTYVKNPTYFVEGKPHLDQVNLLIMSDPAAAMAAMRTGQMDATGSINETILTALESSNPDMVVRNQTGLTVNQIMFNQAKKPFDDYRVRKAIAMGWDRKGMGDQFYSGAIMSGPYPSTLFGGMSESDALDAIPYDPEGAKKLLADAGYPDGFSVKMLTTDGYGTQFVSQAQWVQQDLAKIGVKVDLNIIDYATYFSTFQKEDYDIGWGLGTAFLTVDEWLQALYQSNGTRNWFNSGDATLDAMITEQSTLLDDGQRKAKLAEINSYIMDKGLNPFIGMQISGLLTTQTWVHNMYTHPQYARPYLADVWLSADAPGRK